MKHVSASQITTFADCPRKWYLDKIVGLDRPSTPSTLLGSRVHELLEDFLRNGVEIDQNERAGKIALQGIHHLPDRTQHLKIELSLEDMPIFDSPVPVKGFIDIVNLDNDEIIDHKTTKSKRWTKTQGELAYNLQMTLYAKAYLDNNPLCNKVTLTHIYYGTQDAFSHKVSTEVTRAHIANQWNGIKKAIKEMQETSEAEDAGCVPANFNACDKYGGCPFRKACEHASKYTPDYVSKKKDKPMSKTKNTIKSNAPRLLFIGCFPMKGASTPKPFTEVYKEEIESLCKTFGVPHIGLVEYGRGWSALAGKIKETGSKESAIYIDPLTKEYEHVVSTLIALSDIVIRKA